MIVYKGPSQLNGKPILAIITLGSENRKTGPMAQMWIVPQRKAPVTNVNEGLDDSVCGDCKQRRSLGGACYVNIGHGPQAVWHAWRRGSYKDNTSLRAYPIFKEMSIRLGAWGDPAAIPKHVITSVVSWFHDGASHTGYTHQWRRRKHQWLKDLVMASVDNLPEYERAKAMGWRCFRVVKGYSELTPGERVCANDSHGTQCEKCMACHGGAGADITIEVHGTVASRFIRATEAAEAAEAAG